MTQPGTSTRRFLWNDVRCVIFCDGNNRTKTFLGLANRECLECHYDNRRPVVKTVHTDGSSQYNHYNLFNRTERVETFDGHAQINYYAMEGMQHSIAEGGKLTQFIFRKRETVDQKKERNMNR